MNQGRSVFAQVMDFLPERRFRTIVERYRGDYKVRSLSSLEHFYVMAFAQLTYREGLRDIEACLTALGPKLYHMGIRNPVRRSTLADANETRDWRIFAETGQMLTEMARLLYMDDPLAVDIQSVVYAFDSTTVDLCLSLFPWAKFRRTKAAVKAHTLLDIRGSIPSFLYISDGSIHDVNALDTLLFEPGAIYLLDRAYLDFTRLHKIRMAGSFFITRAKRNLKISILADHPARGAGVIADQTIQLTTWKSHSCYREPLRLITCKDEKTQRMCRFLTNHFLVPAETIAALYRERWKVELFFKWIKQHLRIKVFYGTSENAVKMQIWSAVCVYLLVAIAKKELRINFDLYRILQVLSVHVFEKVPIQELLVAKTPEIIGSNELIQLELFKL